MKLNFSCLNFIKENSIAILGGTITAMIADIIFEAGVSKYIIGFVAMVVWALLVDCTSSFLNWNKLEWTFFFFILYAIIKITFDLYSAANKDLSTEINVQFFKDNCFFFIIMTWEMISRFIDMFSENKKEKEMQSALERIEMLENQIKQSSSNSDI